MQSGNKSDKRAIDANFCASGATLSIAFISVKFIVYRLVIVKLASVEFLCVTNPINNPRMIIGNEYRTIGHD